MSVEVEGECNKEGCHKDAEILRRVKSTPVIRRYCKEHDPLEDELWKDHWEEAEE